MLSGFCSVICSRVVSEASADNHQQTLFRPNSSDLVVERVSLDEGQDHAPDGMPFALWLGE